MNSNTNLSQEVYPQTKINNFKPLKINRQVGGIKKLHEFKTPYFNVQFFNKGDIEISFYWLFVFIVGAVILSFFFVVSNRALNVSEDRSVIEFSRNFNAFLISMLQSQNSEKALFFDQKIDFRCNPSFCEYLINDKGTPFEDKVIFAPKSISGSVVVLAKSFDVPFRVANIIYLFSSSKKYYLVSDNNFTVEFPEKISYEFIDVNSLGRMTDFDDVKFVFLNTQIPSLPESSRKHEIFGILVSGNNVEFYVKEKGSVYFKKVSNSIILPFDDLNLVLGAVVSDDADLFSNQLSSLVKRVNTVSLIYLNRVKSFSSNNCVGHYADAERLLQKYVDESGKFSQNKFMHLPKDELVGLNNNIIRDSCPEVF